MSVLQILLVLVGIMRSKALLSSARDVASHDYANALSKSILFFEGQRSGKLPPSQRMTWRKDSALRDGFEIGVDLVGGYYDAGDNLKFNFPMAFSATMLAWSVIEFGDSMGSDELPRALEAVRWATDYLLKATSVPGLVFVQVGEPYGDHNCWERPEDMDTPRTPYAVSKHFPGSEVAAETAAALAAASIAFRASHPAYSAKLLRRAKKVFNFADKYRGSYNDSLGPWVCPFYCDFSGYQDELLWGAAWLFKATNNKKYWNYVTKDTDILDNNIVLTNKDGSVVAPSGGRAFEFGWDSKHGGINVLLSKFVLSETPSNSAPFGTNSDKLICSLLPESPAGSVSYSSGGLLFKPGGSNLQHATALSFLLIAYSRYLNEANRSIIQCDNFSATPSRLIQVAKTQVDYILGNNPMKMSYMVGYGKKYPKRIHHRGSTLPSKDQYKGFLGCHDGTPYFNSIKPNHNVLVGAVVGGPDFNDYYADSRADFGQSEPTTYINAPLVGVLAYFKSHPY